MKYIRKIFYKRLPPIILKKMNTSNDISEMSRYQDMMINAILSSFGFVGAFVNLLLGKHYFTEMRHVLFASLSMIVFSVLLNYITFHIKNDKLRVYLMSFSIVGILMTIVSTYYILIGPAIWTLIFMVLILSLMRLDRIMFSIVVASAIALNNYLYFNHLNEYFYMNKLYYIVHISIFIGIFIVGLLWNKIFKDRFILSHMRFLSTVEQKEQITQLYEENIATEEELRVQNKRLIEYNEEIKNSEEKLKYMAYNDMLTGLPNRKYVIEKLNIIKDIAYENDSRFAIAFIDIDGFKKINDTYGHHMGDLYLVEIANRLNQSIEENDTVGRFGGDEFALIINRCLRKESLYVYLDKIREKLNGYIMIDNNRIYSSVSIGISQYPEDASQIVNLFKAADAAMYKVKESGKNNIQFYNKDFVQEILDKILLEKELIEAFEKNEFFLMYQPQVSLTENHEHGFEALLRWQSEKHGIVMPIVFIPILEDIGLIHKVGNWVLEEACRKIVDLNAKYEESYCIAVNISPYQLKEDSFIDDVLGIYNQYDIKKGQLELEITESALIENVDKAINKLKIISDHNISISLDDFGTGYASLNYLNRLPLNKLKIDKLFIWDIEKSESSKRLIQAIIDISHSLMLTVVAEGVENYEQLNFIRNEACDYIQGYLFSKPLVVDKLDAYIEGLQKLNIEMVAKA